MAIYFFEEGIKKIPLKKLQLKKWIKECISSYSKITGDINFIFCSDEYLKDMNISYLSHNYYTDVITFGSNEGSLINGDIYISVDRVAENSGIYNVDFFNELSRVIIHGVLHLLGYEDSSDSEKEEMRNQEDICLRMLENMCL